MPTIETCGNESKRTTFTYHGNVESGVTFAFESGDFFIPSHIIQNVINHFRGQSIRGGFSMTEPTPGGVGEFIASLGNNLTPRHASFLCAVLQHQGHVNCTLSGNAVVVQFNA
jgi:hypothetical protein